MSKYVTLLFAAFLSCLAFLPAQAGTSCKNINHDSAIWVAAGQRALELKNVLNKLNPKVALIARVGSDVKKYGLYYTHVAFVMQNFSKKSKWTVVHLLNTCGTASSSLYSQGLMNFFLDDLLNTDFEVIVPKPDLQEKISHILVNSTIRNNLHTSHYSMIAYPFSTRYQNSNQWVLEIIAAAESGQSTRQQTQQFLQKTHYQPTVITLGSMEKLGANLFKQNVRFDDHPLNEKRSNHFSLVSVDSILNWLKKNNQLQLVREYHH